MGRIRLAVPIFALMLGMAQGCASSDSRHHRSYASAESDRYPPRDRSCRPGDTYVHADECRDQASPSSYYRLAPRRSMLLGGDGLDPVALDIGRSGWPQAFRDQHSGEFGSYYVVFNDVQGTWNNGFSWWPHGGYTWRRFRSDQVGSYRR